MHNVILQSHMDNIEDTKGVSFKDAYITADITKDFENADFSNTRLHNIKMKDAVFTECNFSGATISADITNVKFVRCNFENTTFHYSFIFDSTLIDNDFTRAHFLRSSIHQTELSKNNFFNMKMDDVNMRNITVNELNDNGNTIIYGFPGATQSELQRMEQNIVNEISGVAAVYREAAKTNTNSYDAAIEEALQAAELPELDFEMEM